VEIESADFDFDRWDLPHSPAPDSRLLRLGKSLGYGSCVASASIVGYIRWNTKRKTVQLTQPDGTQVDVSISDATTEMEIPKSDTKEQVPEVSPETLKDIRELITTLGESSVWGLLRNSFRLNDIGNKLEPLHPFQFLCAIFTAKPPLFSFVDAILKDDFKKGNFLQGINKGMGREASTIELYIDDFAKKTGTTPDRIRSYLPSRNWLGLIRHLIHRAILSEHKG